MDTEHSGILTTTCKVVPLTVLGATSSFSMTKIHRLQVGVDENTKLIFNLPTKHGYYHYEDFVGKVPAGIVNAVNRFATPILFIPISVAILSSMRNSIEVVVNSIHSEKDFIRLLPELVHNAVDVTVTPSRNIWDDAQYSVDEYHDDIDNSDVHDSDEPKDKPENCEEDGE